MPLKQYGVWKGVAVAGKPGSGSKPHYQVRVSDSQLTFRIAVNVRSQLFPPDVLYFIDENFTHPITEGLVELDKGFHRLPSKPGGLALDYIRGNLFDVKRFKPLPADVTGPDNDLNDLVQKYIFRATTTEDALIYAFGERWGPEEQADRYFDFRPGNGMHDIHMNQGSSGRFAKDNGVYQDGGLLIQFPSDEQWVAVFLAFQSQKLHSDDQGGGGLEPQIDISAASVRIVAALVNPPGTDPGRETVTLINVSNTPVDLSGWSIADKQKHRTPIENITLVPGGTQALPLSGNGVQLSNEGGILTLLDPGGIKIDGVSYTRQAASKEGWTVVF